MELQGARCAVRPWRLTDAEPLVRHANDTAVARQLRDRFPHPYTASDATAFLRMTAGARDASNLAIEVEGEAAGGVGFVRGTDVERYSAEIGYWLGSQHWGRGIMTEALTLVTAYAFESLNLLRLYALPFADNDASVRVLEKAGYAREGLLRASAVKLGTPRDQLLYAAINPAWRGI
jgi:[ribosomal protein S5]-alanine N-acetyltransferase